MENKISGVTVDPDRLKAEGIKVCHAIGNDPDEIPLSIFPPENGTHRIRVNKEAMDITYDRDTETETHVDIVLVPKEKPQK